MVNLLGATLPDRKLVKIALLAYHGINHHTSSKIMARLQFHDQLRVQDLTETQLNQLSALLSAPAAAPRPSTPLAPFSVSSAPSTSASGSASSEAGLVARDPPPAQEDPITGLLIEEDLRRKIRADIGHHRSAGSTKGRLHAMGLPVRGQRNRTNGKTAKRLNRIERRGFATQAIQGQATGSSRVMDSLRTLWSSQGRTTMFGSR